MRRALALVALLGALAAPAAAAAGPPHRTTLADLEDEVMCVTCRVPLEIADSAEANRERAFIRSQIDEGKTKAQVKRALVGQYGPRVLATPSDKGVDLAAWIVPGLAILVALSGITVLLVHARRRGSRAGGAGPAVAAGPPLSDADARRLDDELARFDR